MTQRLQVYESDQVRVTFDPGVCAHSGVCLRSLPAVFDIQRKKWIDPAAAPAEAVLAAVAKCPSGALRAALVTSVHQALPEAPQPVASASPPTVRITVRRNGSLRIDGRFEIIDEAGNRLREGEQCALCRCGHSKNKPFCDSSHETIDWRDDAT